MIRSIVRFSSSGGMNARTFLPMYSLARVSAGANVMMPKMVAVITRSVMSTDNRRRINEELEHGWQGEAHSEAVQDLVFASRHCSNLTGLML